MDFNIVIEWLQKLVYGALEVSNWFITPLTFGEISISPLLLLTCGGLILYLGLAITKWVIS